MKDTFFKRLLENASNPQSIGLSILNFYREQISDADDSAIRAIKNDINGIPAVITRSVDDELVSLNIMLCSKYPQLFEFRGSTLQPCTQEYLHNLSTEDKCFSLCYIWACLSELLDMEIRNKSCRTAISAGRKLTEHIALAAFKTILESPPPKQDQ